MLYLHAVGHFHPAGVIDNAFLESLDIGTNDQWITERVGIKTRHTVLPLDYIRSTKNRDPRGAIEAATMTNAQTGAAAARVALARAGLTPKDIGMVLTGDCLPDENIPAEACRVAEALGIEGGITLDVSAACSSFGAQLYLLDSMRPERLPDFILVVNPENFTRALDYSDRTNCVLFGDCSAAAIVSPRVPSAWKVTQTRLSCDPSGADKVKIPRLGHFSQSGAEVQKFAIKRATETVLTLREAWQQGGEGRTADRLSFIGHQANLRMLEATARRCEVPEARHHFNVDRRGNVGAAGAPSVLSELWDTPHVLGEAIALAVVGSGLTWAGALIERHAGPPAA